MFTVKEISLLEGFAASPANSIETKELFKAIIKKCKKKPQILVTINGGAFLFAHANMDIEVIIEDQVNIDNGDDLYYFHLFLPVLSCNTQEEFNKYLRSTYEATELAKINYLSILKTQIKRKH